VRRRAELPGAAELFRITGAPSPTTEVGPLVASGNAATAARPAAVTPLSRARDQMPVVVRRSSGRRTHDEKITVYLTAEELVDLERVRLELRARYGIGVDRGRIVRQALAIVLADFEVHDDTSVLVRQLSDRRGGR